jgi:fatty acid synthase subunit alpha, fungi type
VGTHYPCRTTCLSPVRWIETQDLLSTAFNFERLVEIGPSPTLTGMATRTLKAKYETLDGSVTRNRSILCHARDVNEIYYQYEDEVEAPASSGETVDAPTIIALHLPPPLLPLPLFQRLHLGPS